MCGALKPGWPLYGDAADEFYCDGMLGSYLLPVAKPAHHIIVCHREVLVECPYQYSAPGCQPTLRDSTQAA